MRARTSAAVAVRSATLSCGRLCPRSRIVFSARRPVSIHDHARRRRSFIQFDRTSASLGPLRTVLMVAAKRFEIPSHSSRRPCAAAGHRTAGHAATDRHRRLDGRDRRGGRRCWRSTGGWSRSRLSPADGPLTVRAERERTLVTLGVEESTSSRFIGRHALKSGIDADRPGRRRAARPTLRQGYLEFTHLVGLPHTHVPVPVRRLCRHQHRAGRSVPTCRTASRRQPPDAGPRPARVITTRCCRGHPREPPRQPGVPGWRAIVAA